MHGAVPARVRGNGSGEVATRPGRRLRAARGFSLIELLIALVIVSILMAIALPSYKNYVIRASREQAQTLLMSLAGLQEKIFLNSSAYAVGSSAVTNPYNGTNANGGGLGLTSGTTPDGKYTISAAGTATTFTLTATPVAGQSNEKDGTITIDDTGQRRWNHPVNGTKPW